MYAFDDGRGSETVLAAGSRLADSSYELMDARDGY